jgi:hypothetical protein
MGGVVAVMRHWGEMFRPKDKRMEVIQRENIFEAYYNIAEEYLEACCFESFSCRRSLLRAELRWHSYHSFVHLLSGMNMDTDKADRRDRVKMYQMQGGNG